MTERLHDATAELRVRFTEGGVTQEFSARLRAEKFTPMVVNIRRDNATSGKPDPGGQIVIESRAPIKIVRRQVDPLPFDIEMAVEAWITAKRHELQQLAAKKVKAGATKVRINERGEMRKA